MKQSLVASTSKTVAWPVRLGSCDSRLETQGHWLQHITIATPCPECVRIISHLIPPTHMDSDLATGKNHASSGITSGGALNARGIAFPRVCGATQCDAGCPFRALIVTAECVDHALLTLLCLSRSSCSGTGSVGMFAILLVQLCVATKRSVLRNNPESGSGSGKNVVLGVMSACSGTTVAAA